jgi:hypothetical protein
MNKQDLTLRLARESQQSEAKAADDVDTLVYKLLKDLKKTQGKLSPERRPDTKKATRG